MKYYRQLLLLVLCGLAISARAGNMEDAERELQKGKAGRAAQLYAEVNEELPTSAGLNNMGVALERSGRYAEAVSAYEDAAAVSPGSEQIRTNLRRARIRHVVSIAFPYAVVFLIVMAVCLVACSLKDALCRLVKKVRRRRTLRKIRVSAFSHHAVMANGSHQPDGNIYYDTATLEISATIEAPYPRVREVLPLTITAQIDNERGSTVYALRETFSRADASSIAVSFSVSDVARLHNLTSCRVALVLENTGRTLIEKSVRVISKKALIADIVTEEACLVVQYSDTAICENVVLTDAEAIIPCITLAPKSCCPQKYGDMTVMMDLVDLDGEEVVDHVTHPMRFVDGRCELPRLTRPIREDDIESRTGNWEVRVYVDGGALCTLPFVLISPEEARENIKLQGCDIAGIKRSGHVFRVGPSVYRQDLKSLAPVFSFFVRYPSRRLQETIPDS